MRLLDAGCTDKTDPHDGGRRRSWHYGTAGCGGSPRWITPRCCGCWRTGTMTSLGLAPRRSDGFMPCSGLTPGDVEEGSAPLTIGMNAARSAAPG
jgi:hypothetical protein